MRTDEFRSWLQKSGLGPKPLKDCISRCRKVEKALQIDLDEQFESDRGQSVISSLRYSADDERNGIQAPECFGFKEGANIRFRFTDLRSATKKYFSFCALNISN